MLGWLPRISSDREVTQPVAVQPPSLEEQFERLANLPGVITRSWTATNDPAAPGVSGDVVWDNQSQTGYMRFRGLPANDPRLHQYQMWIFDATRDEKYPIDGGVFNIGADGEVIVPILAKLQVRDPAMFAVTLEQPGGVVVTDREHILVLAKVAES